MNRKRELELTIKRLKSSNTEMLAMYKIVRAMYIFPSSLMSVSACNESSDGNMDISDRGEVSCGLSSLAIR